MPRPRSSRNHDAPAAGKKATASGANARAKTAKSQPAARAAPAKAPKPPKPPRAAYPKKNQPPTPAGFAALLPLALGKRMETVRGFLTKQKNVSEDVFYYGPQSGWGLRYLAG